jgi:HD superfamily phosphodiesterase
MVERMASRTESELAWAARTARGLLAQLEARWRHTLQVVERAQSFRDVLESDELKVLLAAAYLHDIGYAPELAETGFHPLDGARFTRDAGHERLAGLVAHHSAADAEAEERGLAKALAEFREEDSLVARALTYCDLTTGPGGEYVDVAARFARIAERLGEDEPIVRAVRREATRLTALVDEMEALLAGGR